MIEARKEDPGADKDREPENIRKCIKIETQPI